MGWLTCFDKNGPVRGDHFCQISMVLNKIGHPCKESFDIEGILQGEPRLRYKLAKTNKAEREG